MTTSVSPQQRFTRYGLHCPICGGHSGLKPGHSERCAGFLPEDGEYVFCTREEYAAPGMERNENTSPPAFCHKLYGACNCGKEHNPARVSSNGHKPQPAKAGAAHKRINAEYSYLDGRGRLAYQTVRYDPKGFTQRRPGEKGEWIYNLNDVTRIPYRLPELLKASLDELVYDCEGEKAADAAAHLGVIATTNVCGAGKWLEEYNEYFKDRRVVILPDNDAPGRAHAEKVAQALTGIARSVQVLELPGLPEKGDICEWIDAGGTREQLEALASEAPYTWQKPQRKFLYASDVQTEPVDYQWEKRLAKGMLTLLVGDPGLGKGLVAAEIAAQATTGSRLPDGKVPEPGGVIIMSPEDSYEHTIVPRLKAAGADLTKIILLSEVPDFDSEGKPYNRPISFPEDAGILEEAIIECKASIAIIDPVLAMVNGKYDTHKDQESRQALARVLSIAKQQKCAILGIFHLNKAQSGNVLYRSAASIAFIAMARIGLFLVPDPDNPDNGRVLVNHKNNLAAKATSLRFTIEQNSDEMAYIQWNGASLYSEQELLNQSTPTNNPKSEQETGLIDVLKENGIAMTPVQIYANLSTGQSLNALEVMLKRKLEQGVLIRPSKGLYTYNGNPLYTPKAESDVSPVSNVSAVSPVSNVSAVSVPESNNNTAIPATQHLHFGDDVSVENATQNAPQADTADTYNTYITFDKEAPFSTPQVCNNGPKTALEARAMQDVIRRYGEAYNYPRVPLSDQSTIPAGKTAWDGFLKWQDHRHEQAYRDILKWQGQEVQA